jgi:hypothetical protein
VDFELIHVLCCHIGFLRDPIGVYREPEPLRGFCIAFHLSDEASDGYVQPMRVATVTILLLHIIRSHLRLL